MRGLQRLWIPFTTGLSIVLVLAAGLVFNRSLPVRQQALERAVEQGAGISRLSTENEARGKELRELSVRVEKLYDMVEENRRNVQSQILQLTQASGEDGAKDPEQKPASDNPGVSVNQAEVSPEQLSTYQDIVAAIKYPGDGVPATFGQLEARALELPLSLQEQFLRDIKTMVNNGDIDVETFFAGY